MTLAEKLDAFLAGLLERADPAVAGTLLSAAADLAKRGLAGRAVAAGQIAPDFTLPDQNGRMVSLHGALADGPVVLVFFRGGWCPFCTLSLRALEDVVPELTAMGGQVIGVSPQLAELGRDMAERHGLSFPLLSDHGNDVARAYGLDYELSPELRAIYDKLGHTLPKLNGVAEWRLPIPAGYVIGAERRIVHAVVDPQVNVRLDPADAVAAVRGIKTPV